MKIRRLNFAVLSVCSCCITPGLSAVDSQDKAAPSSTSNQSLPRYKLTVGQELAYEGSSHYSYGNSSEKENATDRTTFWVTANNPDGSWHIVAQSRQDGQNRQTFDSFDLFPDGRLANVPADPQASSLTSIIAKLPADLDQGRAGWEASDSAETKSVYKFDPDNTPASGQWIIEKDEKSLFSVVYLYTNRSRVYFETARGLITKIERESAQGYGINSKGRGLIELKSDSKKSPDWVSQFARESQLFLKAKADLQALYASSRNETNSEKTIAAAEKALTDARQQVKNPIIEAQFADALSRLKDSAKYMAQDKLEEEKVLNKPAAEWALVDLDGKKHSLQDFQGKVVVLDFWYRGCGWCIRAMPQLKELTDDFKNKPVAILGMNTDRQINDARFVVDKLQLNYVTLRAEGIPERYHVQGFPTLILIDQKGIVRGRHVGFSPTLREDIAKQVNALLADGS
jgi:thiol-disulfide isomerase/thioredoxin